MRSFPDPLNRSVTREFPGDVRSRGRPLILFNEPEIGVKELLFMVGKSWLRLELSQPFGSLTCEDDGKSPLFDLLPPDVVDKNVHSRTINIFE